ncbi:DUF4232 domain-containing protein [Streptomyces griseocarneus]|uniref:DUF4232 domain-containing protein n=1 Tax=Streptomyces griseocarneus TaxID=51201 RepID=UPI00167CA4B8|nr:DUF4232 domain-containing protein [Streptomyces griseocarneus]MBZ6472924.1 DUF4232 domain-containing protein [Streptomyces griseocarneus]GHG58851.1 hypothetical protein GCM10018779_24740 [Streptomyces griseocarneus]
MTTRTLRIAAAALTAVAALTLTACGGSDAKEDKAKGEEQASMAPGDGAEGDGAEGSDGGDDSAGDTGKPRNKGDACAPDSVKVEVKAVKSPVNHVLLVATNTSKSPCFAYGFPFLRFDQDQATAGVVEESRPQDRVSLAPGKSAYAGVRVSAADGSGGKGRDAREVSVTFQQAKGDPIEGSPSQASLPDGKLHIDDSARTSYWLNDEAAALKW